MIVDCHAHMVSSELIAAVRKDAAKFPNIKQNETDHGLALTFGAAKQIRPVSKPLSDIPARLAWMDKNGIDKQVVGQMAALAAVHGKRIVAVVGDTYDWFKRIVADRRRIGAADLASVSSGKATRFSAVIGRPPMAYTSLSALAAAMRPKSNGSSTIGVKKSTVWTSARSSATR